MKDSLKFFSKNFLKLSQGFIKILLKILLEDSLKLSSDNSMKISPNDSPEISLEFNGKIQRGWLLPYGPVSLGAFWLWSWYFTSRAVNCTLYLIVTITFFIYFGLTNIKMAYLMYMGQLFATKIKMGLVM